MRTRTDFGPRRPEKYKIVHTGNDAMISFREDITSRTITEDDVETVVWDADEYILMVPWADTLTDRVKDNYDVWLQKAKDEDYEKEAAAVRSVRNDLLANTDKDMVLDRMGLDIPSGTTFQSWLKFLQELGGAVSGDMAEYRQALRDLTKQEGFPYDVEWPEI